MGKVRIPVGEENFELLRKKKSYYVDKTGFIAELMEDEMPDSEGDSSGTGKRVCI